MPVLSRFYGIIIKMYFIQKEHNPPHIHVIYNEETFSITIQTKEIIGGEQNPTKRVLGMVKEWIDLYEDKLLEMWETQDIYELPPLK